MGEHNTQSLHLSKFEPNPKVKSLAYAFILIGVITFAAGLINNQERIWTSYLTSFFYFSCLSLGGLFFAAINHMTKAGWSTSVRRIGESFTAFIPMILLGGLVLLAGIDHLYVWADEAKVQAHYLLVQKVAYLNKPFFVIRVVVFAIAMLVFSKIIIGNSLKQDVSGDANLTHKNVGWSVGFVLFFSLGFSIFSVDLLMTLLPYWYSTIFGIYTFAGLIQSFFALMILMTIWIKNSGVAKGYITSEHLHDLGKYLKGFTVFWAYIAFSQFMLIWYANIPEETEFYLMRSHGGWMAISMLLLVFRFIVPFIALLPRWAKRNETHISVVSVLVLVMQYVDIFWLVYPNFNDHALVFSFWEVGMFIGFAGIFMAMVFRFLSQNSVVAHKDPRIHEALSHHVTY